MRTKGRGWFFVLVWVAGARGEEFTFDDPMAGKVVVEGNLLTEEARGGLLIEGRDGRQWVIAKDRLIERRETQKEAVPFTTEEMAVRLLDEYGSPFKLHKTKNYLIVHATSALMAEDAGKLFERLRSVFENYMRKQAGFEPRKLARPMVVVIFSSREEFIRRLLPELGPVIKSSAGVYVPGTNRMYLFDMMGGKDSAWLEKAARLTRKSPDEIAMLLETEMVATVIHEGIHQVAFNTGFHERAVRNPLWLVEGLATLLEVPELDSKTKWGGVGQINWERAEELRQRWGDIEAGFLTRLVESDIGFRDVKKASQSYAEAWGLTYYLTKTHKRAYMDYAALVSARPALVEYSSEDRLRDFREAFGMSPEQMEGEFRRYVEKVVFTKKRPDGK